MGVRYPPARGRRTPWSSRRWKDRGRTPAGGPHGIAGHPLAGAHRSGYPAGADPPDPGRGVIAMAMGWFTALIGVSAVLVAVRIGVTVPRPRLTGGLGRVS